MVRTRTRNYPNTYPAKRRRTMASATARKLSRLRLPEVKYRDYFNGSAVGAEGIIQNMLVPQGDDGDDYIGSKLFLERLDTTCHLQPDIDANSARIVRLTVLMPKDPTTTPVLLKPSQRYDERLFTILYDEVMSGYGQIGGARRKVNIKRVQEKVNPSSDVVIKGNVFVCWNWGSNLFTDDAKFECTTRLYFTD